MFDYDGTLTPIVDHPDLAILSSETRELLTSLSREEKYVVGVVSGRSLDDVRARVGIAGLVYAGDYGLEIQGPELDFAHPEAAKLGHTQSEVFLRLREELADVPGVLLEDKGLTLSIHYRLTPQPALSQVEERFAAAVAPFLEGGQVEVTRGKKVLEVRPNVRWNKGNAIAKIKETYDREALTVFFGDDSSDEDGFAVAQAGDGLAILVGPARQPTQAWYRVDSPQEVAETLRLLIRL